eukprot:PRCOL_00006920-RA
MMAFWGTEVPAGAKRFPVEVDENCVLHITQAALAPGAKKGSRASVSVTVDGEPPVVLGTLTGGSCDQMMMDLLFHADFHVDVTNGPLKLLKHTKALEKKARGAAAAADADIGTPKTPAAERAYVQQLRQALEKAGGSAPMGKLGSAVKKPKAAGVSKKIKDTLSKYPELFVIDGNNVTLK